MGNEVFGQKRLQGVSQEIPKTVGKIKLNQAQVTKLKQFGDKVQTQLNKHNNFKEKFSRQQSRNYKIYGKNLYIGEFDQFSKPTGFGKIHMEDGGIYVGEFQAGKLQGRGMRIMPDGTIYQGIFRNNNLNGKGTYKSEDLEFEGEFVNGIATGHGKQLASGYNFEGIYQNGRKVKGILNWKDNANIPYVYEGQFNQNNQFQGKGRLQTKKGTYKGQFKKGLKNGQGQFRYKNGAMYSGTYVNDIRQGQGTIYSIKRPDQDIQQVLQNIAYKGEFSDDLPHGIGSVYDTKAKKLRKGRYDHGESKGFIQDSKSSSIHKNNRQQQ